MMGAASLNPTDNFFSLNGSTFLQRAMKTSPHTRAPYGHTTKWRVFVLPSALLLGVLLFPYAVLAQTATIKLRSEPATPGSYTASGAKNFSGTFTVHTGQDDDRILEAFEVGTTDPTSYPFRFLADQVNLVRVKSNDHASSPAAVQEDRESIFMERTRYDGAAKTLDLAPTAPPASGAMEAVLLSRIVNRGVNNIFVNRGGDDNNIERVDFVFLNGLTLSAEQLNAFGFLITERGGNNGFQIAAITGIDGGGNPTAFGALAAVAASSWSDSDVSIATTTLLKGAADAELRPAENIESQALSGVYVSAASLGVTAGSTFYGYAIFPSDVSASSDLVGLTDVPLNTTNAAGGGLDLLAGGTVFTRADAAYDSDGDGIPDDLEDVSGDGDRTNDDQDGDGVPNYLDLDSDNDGLADAAEAGTDPGRPADTDQDDTPDYLDLDTDGDTIADLIEGNDGNQDGRNDHTSSPPSGYEAVADVDGDGRIDPSGPGAFIDTNANGLDDRYEVALGGTEAAKQNTDAATGDPAPDWRDGDDDGDSIPTKDEAGDTSPENGTPDYLEAATLPVERAALEARADGEAVVLSWRTSADAANVGFHVEMRQARAGAFETLGFVGGAGTTEATGYRYRTSDLGPGRYAFRLRQVRRDGTARYSAEVEVTVAMAEPFTVEPAYPNPFNPSATVRFAVRERQPVRVVLYDVMGREVAVLFDGPAAAGQMQAVPIDGSGLASGLYLVRVAGQSFSRTQAITLVK